MVFQTRPLIPGYLNDGSQAVLLDLLKHMSDIGVRTVVYCGQHRSHADEFELWPGVTVRPVLPFNMDGGDPYQAPIYHLARIIDILRRGADESDAVYVHDSNLRFEFIASGKPLVRGVFDLFYPHTLAGVIQSGDARLVANSDYVGNCIKEALRRFRTLGDNALRVVNTGFQEPRFRPGNVNQMRDRLRLPEDALPILYPHRPDPTKGIFESLAVVQLLRKRLHADQFRSVRLLVSVWEDFEPGQGIEGLGEPYPTVFRQAAELGIADKLHLHSWVPRHDMSNYYALGAATLSIGTFPEAFGHVHVESMLSGTPAITSRVAAYRTTVPEELARKVDPTDVEAAADQLVEVLGRRERTGAPLQDHLRDKFGFERMLDGYSHAFFDHAEAREGPFTGVSVPVAAGTRLRIPPWAAALDSGYYNDYSGYAMDKRLEECLPFILASTTVETLKERTSVSESDILRWLRNGHLLSLNS